MNTSKRKKRVFNEQEYLSCMGSRLQAKVHALFADGGRARHADKFAVIDQIIADEKIPLSMGIAGISRAADQAARECFSLCIKFKTILAIKMQILILCQRYGVDFPIGATDAEQVKRALCKAWWKRVLSVEHKRRVEHAHIQIGLTGRGGDEYLSRESALTQKRQNTANRKLLESVTVTNGVDKFLLSELSDLSTANKTIRRGELMARIRGFEEVALELNHVAMFWTITCPSSYHSVGGTNKKYNGKTPRQAQAYLCKIWSRMRAEFKRQEITPYGFRVAEPHTDGCPHWHMLFFVDPKHSAEMEKVISQYAMAEDGSEKGAAENRVKLVHIETHNGMSAAGYIVKYISKNIDGSGVGDHKAFEDGQTYIVKTDGQGRDEITPSQRVTYWSQVWGIRQFQQIGGAPVTVWRELRRVPAEVMDGAPAELAAAWAAVQKTAQTTLIDCDKTEGGKREVTQASFADYLRAQGGAQVGRAYKVRISAENVVVVGKYATYEASKPVGVYAVSASDEIYKSKRYVWERVGVAVAGAFDLPRTGVNNCTNTEKTVGDFAAWVQEKKAKNKNFSSFISGEEVKKAMQRDRAWNSGRIYDKNGFLIMGGG